MRFIVKLIIALIVILPHIVCAQKIDKKYTNFKNKTQEEEQVNVDKEKYKMQLASAQSLKPSGVART